jgi:hypothetical protein
MTAGIAMVSRPLFAATALPAANALTAPTTDAAPIQTTDPSRF